MTVSYQWVTQNTHPARESAMDRLGGGALVVSAATRAGDYGKGARMIADLNLDLLRVFIAIVDGGSLAAAARSLKTSRATVRRNLGELEEQARTPLVFRTVDGLTPTDAGAVIVDRARQMLAEALTLLAQADSIGSEPSGLVRIAVILGTPPIGAALFLRVVRGRWPRLRFEIISSERPHEELLGRADVALTFERAIPEGPWRVLEITTAREWLVASPAYLAHRGQPERPEDLRRHDLLVWRSPEGPTNRLPLLDGGSVAVTPTFIASDIYVLRGMAIAGSGIAYLPDGELDMPDEPAGALVPVLPDVIGSSRPLRLLVPLALEETPRVRAIAECVEMITSLRRPSASKRA